MTILPRDFVETSEGLIFAVVEAGLESGNLLCFLRYQRLAGAGALRKLGTESANALLLERYPDYLYHSCRLDADLHAVGVAAIVRHYHPRVRLEALLRETSTSDPLEGRLCRLVCEFIRRGIPANVLGVTGSLLVGAQNRSSDIDLVVYGRSPFLAAQAILRQGADDGVWMPLDHAQWLADYRRRGAALSFDEFIWHERRKANKAVFQGTKFDLSQVNPEAEPDETIWRKRGRRSLRAIVVDDCAAFDYPARYRIDHPTITEICVHTHTYVGQARRGETVEASGILEQADSSGRSRLAIGSSREAPGEYLRVMR